MKMRRFLALLLCLAVAIAALGVTVFAEGATGFHTSALEAPEGAGEGAQGRAPSPELGDIGESSGPDEVDGWERQPLPECDEAKAVRCTHANSYSIYTGRTYEPTCFAPGGIMIEEYCSDCHAFLNEYRHASESSPAVPHKFALVGGEMRCKYCGIAAGELRSVEQQAACPHDSALVKTVAAQSCGGYTCRVYYCSMCGMLRDVAYDREDGYHHFTGAGETVREATCTQQGIVKVTCDCGKKTMYKFTETLPHQFTGPQRREEPKDCVTDGAVYQLCSACGKEQVVEVIKAKGHQKPANGEVLDNTSAQGHAYQCAVCGETFTEDHQFTSRRSGCEITWKCEVCGYTDVTYEHYFYMNDSYHNSNAAGHMLTCWYYGTGDCTATKWEAHNLVPITDSNGKRNCKLGYRCTVCGWQVSGETSHKMAYEYIDEGHHRGYCVHEDCEFTTGIEVHDWGEDGRTAHDACVKCGVEVENGVMTPPTPAATPTPTAAPTKSAEPTAKPVPTPTPRPTAHVHKLVYESVDGTHHRIRCAYEDCDYEVTELHNWGEDGVTATDTCVKCGMTKRADGTMTTPTPAPTKTTTPTKAPTPTKVPAPAATAKPTATPVQESKPVAPQTTEESKAEMTESAVDSKPAEPQPPVQPETPVQPQQPDVPQQPAEPEQQPAPEAPAAPEKQPAAEKKPAAPVQAPAAAVEELVEAVETEAIEAATAAPAVEVPAAVPQVWKPIAEKLTFTEVAEVEVAASAPVREVIVRQAEIHDEFDAYLALTVEMKPVATGAVEGKVRMSMPVKIAAETFKLVRVEADGSLTEIEFTYEDGILSFDAEDASLYLLVPVEE